MQELQPQIAELLRTCIHPPSLRLRVIHVKFIDVSRDWTEDNDAASDPPTQSIDSAYRYATKLVLSDGELMIQSLLHRRLSTLGDVPGVSIGDLVEIKSFRVKRSPRVHGRGHVVYLAIEDCHLLKEGHPSEYIRSETSLHGKRSRSDLEDTEDNPTVLPTDNDLKEMFYSAEESAHGASKRQRRTAPVDVTRNFEEQEQNIELAPKITTLKSPRRVSFTSPTTSATTRPAVQTFADSGADKIESGERAGTIPFSENNIPRTDLKVQVSRNHDQDDEDVFFESTQTSQSLIDQRRQALRSLDHNVPGKDVLTDSKIHPSVLLENPKQQVPSKPQEIPKLQSQASTVILHPSPPFHTLRSLRSPATNKPLPSKSYTLTTLGFITWIGSNLIHRPGSPFPPKRHLKIIDPSLSISRPPSREANSTQHIPPLDSFPSFKSQNSFQEAVTLAVYLDAANFRPPSGTLALFRGVVMQRLYNGDIILNVYARLKEVQFDDGSTGDEVAGRSLNTNDNSHEHRQKARELDNHWFITDHDKIRSLGCGSRLDYYLEWWKNRDVQT